ncbi:unnamed protein product [Caenorhabditis sp. 36 PRJEB53466]|nr:unnamed protein product [Caenorhabditis sp. 36 PRJEB53466]
MAHCTNPDKYFPTVKTPALPSGVFKGKIALVTGGGTGIGRAIAATFAHLGASVAIASRRMDVLQKSAADIRTATGGICEPFQMDVKDTKMVAKAFDEMNEKFGKTPDILVNNAAGNFIMATERLSPNAYGTIIDIVLKGTLNVTTELGRRCIQQKTGAAVTSITAAYARAGGPFVLPSAVSKAGVEAMTKSLAVEWAKHGLRFNAVSPGSVPTKGAYGRLREFRWDGSPEEVANLVAFISSDYMSWMNGAIIDLDGGAQYINHGSHMGEFLHEYDQQKWEDTENLIRGRSGKKK